MSSVAISVGGHSMFQCCDKIKLGIVASSKQFKIRITPRYSKSDNLFDNNEYNLYRNDFPADIKTRGLNDTIVLNALEKAKKLHGNIFNSYNCFSFLHGTIHRGMANIKSCMCICLIGENTHPSNNWSPCSTELDILFCQVWSVLVYGCRCNTSAYYKVKMV